MNFKNFFIKEWADFGFGKSEYVYSKKIDTHDKPMKRLDINYVIEQLNKITLGVKKIKKNNFFGDVKWGDGDGAILVSFSPYGGMRASIKKQTKDLDGKKIWICENIIKIWDYENPENIIEDISKEIKKIDVQNIPAPKKEYKNLEKLTLEIAASVNRHKGYSGKPIFMYNGIRVVEPNDLYIIMYDITGYGRQAQGQTYVHQYQIFVKFDKEKGFITISGNLLADKLNSWTWQYEPSEFKEYFATTQDRKIIKKCISDLIRSY